MHNSCIHLFVFQHYYSVGKGNSHSSNYGGDVPDAEVRYVFKTRKTGWRCLCGGTNNYRFIKKEETDAWKQIGGARDLVDQSLAEAVGTLRENADTIIKKRKAFCCDNGVDYNAAMRVLNAQYAVQINERLSKFGYSIVARKYSTVVYTQYGPVQCVHLALFVVKQ